MQFSNQQELLDYLKEQNDILSTKKFILLTSGWSGQELFEKNNETLEQNPKIKAVLIYCDKINLNSIWTSKYPKTNNVFTLNTNTRSLYNSVQHINSG